MEGYFPDFDESVLDELFYPLLRYSLVSKRPTNESISIHRVLQEVAKCAIRKEFQAVYRRHLLACISHIFPIVEFRWWPLCQRLLMHAVKLISDSDSTDLTNEGCGNLLHRVANFVDECGDYDLAISIYREALLIRRKVLPPDSRDIGTTTNNLGVVLKKAGYLAAASEVFFEALEFRERVAICPDRDVAQTLQNIGVNYLATNDLVLAYKFLMRAKSILETAGEAESEDYAHILGNIATYFDYMDDVANARKYLENAIAVREAVSGKWHPHLCSLYRSVAVQLNKSGLPFAALRMAVKARILTQRIYGNFHPVWCDAQNIVATVYSALGKLSKAYRYSQDVCLVVSKLGLQNKPIAADSLMVLGAIANDFKQKEVAIWAYSQAVLVHKGWQGPESNGYMTALNNLSYTFMCQGEFAHAIFAYKQLLRVEAKRGRKLHSATINGNLAICYWRLGEMEQAEQRFELAFKILEKIGYPPHPDCSSAFAAYFRFLGQSGQKLAARIIKHRFWRLASKWGIKDIDEFLG